MKFYDGERLPNAGNTVMLENCIVILYQIISKETELHDAADLLTHQACFISSDILMACQHIII